MGIEEQAVKELNKMMDNSRKEGTVLHVQYCLYSTARTVLLSEVRDIVEKCTVRFRTGQYRTATAMLSQILHPVPPCSVLSILQCDKSVNTIQISIPNLFNSFLPFSPPF
jgi:hypothetical protein